MGCVSTEELGEREETVNVDKERFKFDCSVVMGFVSSIVSAEDSWGV
jgi:hypothetical protein